MKLTKTAIADVLLLEPKVFGDARGFFFESFNHRVFEEATGVKTQFVQDNHSKSAKGVLRGLHYQAQNAQGKLVRVAQGEVFDVAVDKYAPKQERCIVWNDPTLAIDWPIQGGGPVLSQKDSAGAAFDDLNK